LYLAGPGHPLPQRYRQEKMSHGSVTQSPAL
jgi:hypothetical protein